MKALDYLNQHRIYEDGVVYNSADEIVGTISQIMEGYTEEFIKKLDRHKWKGDADTANKLFGDNYGVDWSY